MKNTGIDTLQRFNKEKKKVNTLDKYIIFCLSFISIFTIASLVVFLVVGSEATTLTIAVFSTVFSEMLMCFLIKRFKLHEEAKAIFNKKNNNQYDEGGEL